MDLLFTPKPESVQTVYNEIINAFNGREHYLFNSLKVLDENFTPPTLTQDFENAFEDFRTYFKLTNITGFNNLIKVIEKLFGLTYDPADNQILNNLIPKLKFDTYDSFTKIILTEQKYFAAEWKFTVDRGFAQHHEQSIFLDLFDISQNYVMPLYIVEYVRSSVQLYTQGLSKSACALMTIAMEATLRDILNPKGYTFLINASSDDQYKFSEAIIDLNTAKDKYTISFTDTSIKQISDYIVANPTITSKPIKIKRKINHNTGKAELIIRNCDDLFEYFSSSVVDIPGQKTISGLGAALDIARNREGLIEAALLPKDMDDIFKRIRNNLIHLSGDGLSAASVNDQKLIDFLNNGNKVLDLISYVPQFINKKYRQLI